MVGRDEMPEYGFMVELKARADKHDEVERFLADAEALVNDEPGTLVWFAFRIGPSSYRIFDMFETEDARQAHLYGKVREALQARGEELFAAPPVITPVDVLASKLA
jgi:quinol monooxygenase YgiN